ncbi:bifunctional nitrate reductase/sulfite reductase flavoprotein subunit alpha [Mycolicibacterium sphagni]|uniref:bifunctional nitrate reductase/sulfite reductase flavoprotein subunit alpha n=1 Tax=Mycolicibacterium sphagni TaxID=1786 RepID=UPI0021F353CA|nr:bifunctional nitrate reductase/sulfite reductase flavoprotein subunit alpha [Mycolicibacterium sphagni]
MAAGDDCAEPIRTACSYCGVGCGVDVHTRPGPDGPVIAKVVGDRLHPANFGRLCTKGATHAELMADPQGRAVTALMRPAGGEELVAAPVDDAVATVGTRLREILDRYGPDSIALYVSGQMSMEAQYLATKLAKGFIRTVNIESNSRLCMASAASGYKQSLGADGPPGSYNDFDCADVFFVIGANMADCHPILFLRMADRLRAGAKLIVVDPRRTATADKADLFLQIRPGTDLALLNGLLHLLVAAGDIDTEFIAEHTEGWEAMGEFLADYPPARVAELTGLAEADVRCAATMIGQAGEWMSLWTMGLNQSTHGTWNTNAICNLHLATGAICRPGSGPMSLTGQPNAMGGREMGYMGPGLPGQRSVLAADDRAFVEDVWGVPQGTIRADTNHGTIDMFEAMAAGGIKACWIICTNPVASVPNRTTVITGLESAELVVTQDAYADTATNRYADVVLPAALWAESDSVMVNSERNLTLVRQCVAPAGQSRPDWQLICQVAGAMGFGADFDYDSSEQVFDEIRRFTNPKTGYDLRGASYQRLRQTPLQWPCPPDDDQDRHPIRYVNDGVLAFPTPSGRGVFHARPHMDARELPDEDYPFVLNTGRLPHQWHTMTKTGRVDKLTKLDGKPFVEINTDDATTLGIAEGQSVELQSRRGRAVLPAVVTDRVRPGNCFAPFHWNDEHGEYLAINAMTSDAVDKDSLQPELKVCAVSVRPTKTVTVQPAFTDDETQYLAGFFTALAGDVQGVPILLAGTYSRTGGAAVATEPAPGPWVLWASQTGNAEEFAGRITEQCAAVGLSARLVSMDDCSLDDLATARDILVVTSTFGDGGPPDNGADFWERLLAPDAPDLRGLRFAVLGIGDRSYGQFCGHAQSLDTRLAELGANRLIERNDCEIDDEESLSHWATEVIGLVSGGASTSVAPPKPRPAEPFTRADPLAARLSRNIRLTPASAAKEVRQFGFDLSEHDVTYAVGDSLGVQPTNSDDSVNAWLAATALRGDEVVEVDGAEYPLRQALTQHYDICRLTPNLVNFLADTAADKAIAKQLRIALSELDTWRAGRNGLDVLRDFAPRASAQDWQKVLVRLTPRSYSISSSPLVSPREAQLTVSVVRGGVCSTYLAERAKDVATPIFLQRSPHFRPPEDRCAPIVMIGAGTGIAPFRGFLQERRALGHTGRNWLFFGDQHRAENFYYGDDLMDMVSDGFLSRLDLAFSRDQAKRIYVQNKMIDRGALLWSWLQDGAHVYVCGDATTMAAGVDAALNTIIGKHGLLDPERAREYKRELVATKRYLRDVY